MNREQMRAARALLGWSQNDLAEKSGVSAPTIKRWEPGSGHLPVREDLLLKIERTFTTAGIVFSATDGAMGVSLRDNASNRRAALKAKLERALIVIKECADLVDDAKIEGNLSRAKDDIEDAVRLVCSRKDATGQAAPRDPQPLG